MTQDPLIPTIWVDADACPQVVKEIIYRASERLELKVILVANRPLVPPRGFRFISSIKVNLGADVADAYIVDNVQPIDVVITADIPLADLVIKKGAVAIDPRGDLYTPQTISERLSIRNFMEHMRSTTDIKSGPAPFGEVAKQKFANSLDKILAKRMPKNR